MALSVPTAAAAGWVGASHLVAAAIRYHGCPELGAIPTLFLGRRVAPCSPWELLDDRLGLCDPAQEKGGSLGPCCAV